MFSLRAGVHLSWGCGLLHVRIPCRTAVCLSRSEVHRSHCGLLQTVRVTLAVCAPGPSTTWARRIVLLSAAFACACTCIGNTHVPAASAFAQDLGISWLCEKLGQQRAMLYCSAGLAQQHMQPA